MAFSQKDLIEISLALFNLLSERIKLRKISSKIRVDKTIIK